MTTDRLVEVILEALDPRRMTFEERAKHIAAAVRREFCVKLDGHDYYNYAKEDNSRTECNDCGRPRTKEETK